MEVKEILKSCGVVPFLEAGGPRASETPTRQELRVGQPLL